MHERPCRQEREQKVGDQRHLKTGHLQYTDSETHAILRPSILALQNDSSKAVADIYQLPYHVYI